MLPPIPQEVIDLCIDNLAFDVTDSDPTRRARKALLLCSLVSHAFRQRARYHIFSDIRIKPSPGDIRSRQLRDIMKEESNICQLIRTLDINIADEGHKKTATSKTGLPDILNMLSPSSGGKGIEAFKLHGTSNVNPWSRVDKDFLSALVGLIHNIDEGSDSVRGGQFKTLKSVHISGFKEVPVALITNCSYTVNEMKIRYLSFIDTLDAKNQLAVAPAKRKRVPAKPSLHCPLALPPKFILEKFHFTGSANGNLDLLATTFMRDPLPFSQLEEMVIYPHRPEDLAFVWRIMQFACKSLKIFKLYVTTTVDYQRKTKEIYIFRLMLC